MRPGSFRSCQRPVSRQNIRAGNPQALSAQRNQLLQLTLFDGLRLRPALFGPRSWLADELRGNTHLPDNDFRHCRHVQHIGSASRSSLQNGHPILRQRDV